MNRMGTDAPKHGISGGRWEYRYRLFVAVAAHALGHRYLAAHLAKQLTDNHRLARVHGRKHAYYTHCNLAARRDVQHRNTSRAAFGELAAMGLIKTYPYRYHRKNRFVFRWSAIFNYAQSRGVMAMASEKIASLDRVKVRTCKQWEADRAAHAQRRRLAELAATARKQAEARRTAQEAAASQAGINVGDTTRKAVEAMQREGRRVPAWLLAKAGMLNSRLALELRQR